MIIRDKRTTNELREEYQNNPIAMAIASFVDEIFVSIGPGVERIAAALEEKNEMLKDKYKYE